MAAENVGDAMARERTQETSFAYMTMATEARTEGSLMDHRARGATAKLQTARVAKKLRKGLRHERKVGITSFSRNTRPSGATYTARPQRSSRVDMRQDKQLIAHTHLCGKVFGSPPVGPVWDGIRLYKSPPLPLRQQRSYFHGPSARMR